MSLDVKVISALASSAAAIPGSITVATVTTPAAGIAGVLGFTATSAVALPIGGVIAVGALVSYGVHKGLQAAKEED